MNRSKQVLTAVVEPLAGWMLIKETWACRLADDGPAAGWRARRGSGRDGAIRMVPNADERRETDMVIPGSEL